jgi:hypothetical protein
LRIDDILAMLQREEEDNGGKTHSYAQNLGVSL